MERLLWMYNLSRLDPSYQLEVRKFIDAAKKNACRQRTKYIHCPCIDCKNVGVTEDTDQINSHLICRGFMKDYLIWEKHGEGSTPRAVHNSSVQETRQQEVPQTDQAPMDDGAPMDDSDDDLAAAQDVVEDTGATESEHADFFEALLRRHSEPSMFFQKGMEALKKAAAEHLYDESKGCTKEFTTLRAVLQFLVIKARYGWSDAGFNELLRVLGDLLPEGNKVPANTYYAKKLISPLTMGVKRIHACRNHCMLYWGDNNETLESCSKCGASRYKTQKDYEEEDKGTSFTMAKKRKMAKKKTQQKSSKKTGSKEEEDYYAKKKIPALVIWYLPVVDRLRCLFANPEDSKLMSWHESNASKNDGKLRHPSDAKQWKHFNKTHPEFAKEPRNIRFALSTDGMNPFAERSSKHSTWPVILTIYNLPPWLCQKRKYLLLTILISGPKQPGVDMDVFLEPLMKEMQDLWVKGVAMWDEFRKEQFTLRAMIFVTINDYPALFSLSGQWRGKVGCVVCLDDTSSVYLTASSKLVYMRHRRFLPRNHRYRLQPMDQYFDNRDETESTVPSGRSAGKRVFLIVKNIKFDFGKKTKDGMRKVVKQAEGDTFKKMSIFFKYLPYWEDLDIRHAVDGMHVQKNVFESIIGTLLDIPSKTKDGHNSRLDLVNLGIRPELHPTKQIGERESLPSASYNLTPDEKHAICLWLKTLKVPTGFCSNIRSLVSMKDLKLINYNSHDCHVMLTTLLPIAIRAIKPVYLKIAITRLCYFFNKISQKVFDSSELVSLREFAAETMSQLEMCFPPSFFDIMVHLIIHLVDQIEALGPMYLHEMWAYERFMSILNGYMSNRAHPEGSMIESYTTEEAVESGGPFCNNCLQDRIAIGLPPSLHQGRLLGKGRTGRRSFIPSDYNTILEAHHSALHHISVMEPLIEKHKNELRRQDNGHREDWVKKEHKLKFSTWLMDQDIPYGETMDEKTIKVLASGPSRQITTWQVYDINGFTFHVKSKDQKSLAQNSGVRCDAIDEKGKTTTYYGFVEEIWELHYGVNLDIAMFRCQWIDQRQGVSVDDYGLRIVDMSKIGYKDDPWVFADRVAQVFYADDISPESKKARKPKHVALPGKQQITGVDGAENFVNQFSEMPLFTDLPKKIKKVAIPDGELPYFRKDGKARPV